MGNYAIDHFSSGDLNQYFGDSMVQYHTGKGVRAGYIQGFLTGDRVILDDSGDTQILPLSKILWSGLIEPRFINNGPMSVCYIGPAGARSYKKPPTSRNITCLRYHSDAGAVPKLLGPGYEAGSITSSMLSSYLRADPVYPETGADVQRLVQNNNYGVCLSPQSAYLFLRQKGIGILLNRGRVTDPNISWRSLGRYMQEEIPNERS